MAGELRFQLYRSSEYAAVRTAIEEALKWRKLSPSSLECIRAALLLPRDEELRLIHGRGLEALGRIASLPDVDLRTFLAPRALSAAAYPLAVLASFDDPGRASLGDGDTWVTLERTVRLHDGDEPWVKDVFDGSPRLTSRLGIPGESNPILLGPEHLATFSEKLATVIGSSRSEPADRQELGRLARFIDKARSRPGRGIAIETLL
ncbi:MAG TPA: hypothetical protein VLC09_21185 [Polyangiaceae bacterium]|nr:hypothetical protein [Polyangiaceae bacterium]